MTTQRTITEIGLEAMVAFAAEPGNENAFENGKTGMLEWQEKKIFQELCKRLEIPALLKRAHYGRSSSHLHDLAFHAAKSGLKELHELKELLRTPEGWSGYEHALEGFNDAYWWVVINSRIKKGNFRRAWDDVRKMLREPKPFRLHRDKVEMILNILHCAMRDKGVLNPMPLEGGVHHFYQDTPMPGLAALVAFDRDKWRWQVGPSALQPRFLTAGGYEFTYHERFILALAKKYAEDRKKKRGREATRVT